MFGKPLEPLTIWDLWFSVFKKEFDPFDDVWFKEKECKQRSA
jgi:hypothetical protein